MAILKTNVILSAENLISKHLNQINSDLSRLNAKIEETNKKNSALSSMTSKASTGLLAFGAAGATAIGMLAKQAGGLEQTKVAFTTMLGSAEAAQKKLDELASFAAKTPFSIQGVERSAKQLLAVGYNASEIIPTLKSIGDVASGLSLGEDGLQRLILNLGQVRTQGKLTGRELRDFAVNGVPLMDELARMMDKPKAAIADMTEKGQISAPIVEEAFRRMTGEGGKFDNMMQKQSETMLGSYSNVLDSVQRLARELGQPFLEPLTNGFQALTTIIDKAITYFRGLPEGVRNFIAVSSAAVVGISSLVGGLGLLMANLGKVKAAWMAFSGVISVGASTLAAFALPITLVVGGLSLLYLWVTKTDSGKKALAGTIDFAKKAFITMTTSISNAARMIQAIWNVTAGFRQLLKDSAIVAIQNFAGWFSILGQNVAAGIGWLRSFAKEIYSTVVGAARTAIEWLSKIPIIGGQLTGTVMLAGAAMSSLAPVGQTLADTVSLVSTEYNRLGQESKSLDSMSKATDIATKSIGGLGMSFDNLGAGAGGGASKAKEETEKLTKEIEGLGETYNENFDEINKQIGELEDSHIIKMKSIRDEMDAVEVKVGKLKDEYVKSIADMQASTATKIIDEQGKINDLISKRVDLEKEVAKAQLDLEEKGQKVGGVSSMGMREREEGQEKIGNAQAKLDELNLEIAKRQEAYNQVLSQGVVTSDELAEAQRRNSLTELERFIEDQATKKTELQIAHEEKLQQLNTEMENLNKQAAEEEEIYFQKRYSYEVTRLAMSAWHDSYVANLNNMADVTQKQVESMRKKLDELKSLISQIQALQQPQGSRSQSLETRVSEVTTSIPGYANGGIISREGLYIAGEGNKAEAVVPLPDGRSIPVILNNGGGRSISVAIDMSGMTIQNSNNADELVRRVKTEVVEAIINASLESR